MTKRTNKIIQHLNIIADPVAAIKTLIQCYDFARDDLVAAGITKGDFTVHITVSGRLDEFGKPTAESTKLKIVASHYHYSAFASHNSVEGLDFFETTSELQNRLARDIRILRITKSAE